MCWNYNRLLVEKEQDLFSTIAPAIICFSHANHMTESHVYSRSAGVVRVKIQLQTSDDKYHVVAVRSHTVDLSANAL